MTYLGARGETAEELAKVFATVDEQVTCGEGVGKSDAAGDQDRRAVASAAAGLIDKIKDLGTRGVTLEVANALFVQNNFKVDYLVQRIIYSIWKFILKGLILWDLLSLNANILV